ncbi:MAG: MFS transporter [Verrucomicrobiales bacterium]|nr:MFS transporter [Verrucomicrobiales bacterium]
MSSEPAAHQPALTPDNSRMNPAERPCFSSLWKVVVIQAQNSLNDKIAQYVLLGLAIVTLPQAQAETYAHVGAILLAVPLILFAPMAGWFSDRFSKRNIIFWCSAIQFGGMAAISLAFYFDLFWTATFCFFLLATQATIMGPAKGGIVKELVGERHLAMANSWIQGTGLVALVAGPCLGGALFGWFAPHYVPNIAAYWPSLGLALLALVPMGLSARIRTTPSHSAEPFRWRLLWEHFFHLGELVRIRILRLTALGVAFFWFAATLLALLLVQVGEIITVDKTQVSATSGFLLVWVGLGIAVGSVIVGVISVNRIELGLVPIGGLGMAVGCWVLAVLPLGGLLFNGTMFIVGVFSGIFMVPLSAYLQDLVEPAKRGRQLAASALFDSLGMFFGIIVQALWKMMGLTGTGGVRLQFVLLGLLCLATAVYVVRIIPQNFIRFVLLAVIKLVYRVRAIHPENIPAQGGALLIANHVSYIDAFIISASCDRPVRFIAGDQFHAMKWIGPFLKLFNVVPVSRQRAKDAIVSVAEAVAAGDLVCIFPEGQITRTGMLNEIRKGFELIARRSGAPVIPVVLDDLWGSLFSYERGDFFRKWPKRYAYQVSVCWGSAAAADSVSAAWARRSLRQLAGEAMLLRGELRPRLEVATSLALCRQPWRWAVQGRNPVSRGMLLGQAWTLARKWHEEMEGRRVAVLASGYHCILANLALRLAGSIPVNVRLPAERLEEAFAKCRIDAAIGSGPGHVPGNVRWINLGKELAAMDAIRLGMEVAFIHALPRSLLAWRIHRLSRNRHVTSRDEAVAWLDADAEGEVVFRSLTHLEVLLQSEQLANTDVCREGEALYCADGFACAHGTILGLWHCLIAGSTIISNATALREADIFVGGADLGEKLLAEIPRSQKEFRSLYCFNPPGRFPAALELRLKRRLALTVCPCFASEHHGRIVSVSQPDPGRPSASAEPQAGTRSGTLGRVLPGFEISPSGDGDSLVISDPAGGEMQIQFARVDAEDFLTIP